MLNCKKIDKVLHLKLVTFSDVNRLECNNKIKTKNKTSKLLVQAWNLRLHLFYEKGFNIHC